MNRWFYEPKNLKSKCIHIVILNELYEEIYKYSAPSIEAYAKKIGADINLITTPKFLDFPHDYERMQIWEKGENYQWNINICADTVIHPDTEDPTVRLDPFKEIGTIYANDYNSQFETTAYFIRNQSQIMLPFGSVLVSSWYTHDIWEPLLMPYTEMSLFCKKDKRDVSEFNLATNLCKYKYKIEPAFLNSKIFSSGLGKVGVQRIKEKLIEWNY